MIENVPGKERKKEKRDRIHSPLSGDSQVIAFPLSYKPLVFHPTHRSRSSKHPIYNDDARILNQGRSFLRLETPTGSSYWIPTLSTSKPHDT